MKHFKSILLASFVAGLFASWLLLPSAMAFTLNPALKVWSNGEVLKASDLNSNFSTIANAAVRLLVNSDISGSAAIAHSKLATPALVPKAMGMVSATADVPPTYNPCVAGNCLVSSSSRLGTVARASAGVYTVALGYTATNANYVVILQPHSGAGNVNCTLVNTQTTTGFTVLCFQPAGAVPATAAIDAVFGILVMDDNN